MLADNASIMLNIENAATLVIWSYTMKKKSEERVMKKCSGCKVVKSLDEFSKDKTGKSGRHAHCKECWKQYYEANREKLLEYNKQWAKDNKEKKAEYNRQYNQDNKEKKAEYNRQYNQEHKAERNEYRRNRYNNEPAIALRTNVSNLIGHALKRNDGSKQGESMEQYLPYTIEQLKEHLENQFEPWMNWDNQGEWHIDHIYPQSKLPYDSMTHPNFLKCWALENLQPLEAKENISKGNRLYEREAA